jgi:hypothetical protein
LTLSPGSGTTPGSITAALNDKVNTLSDGSYNGAITISALGGQGGVVTIPVTLTVVRQRAVISPTRLDMFHQVDGQLSADTLSVDSSSGSLDWSATTDAQWLALSPLSGKTAGVLKVSLNQNADTLSEGTYTASVTVTATNAVNSPVSVPVTLKVVKAGTLIVTSNLDEAAFTIAGKLTSGAEVTLAGSGKDWMNDEVGPGSYTIQFGSVKGYRRPPSRAFEITTGQSVTINTEYKILPLANRIVAAKGPGAGNDDLVRVLDQTGVVVNEFHAFPRPGVTARFGVKVAMADIDGDGTSEIITVPGAGQQNQAAINVFRQDGTLLSSVNPISGTIYGADIAAGDILGNGLYEVALSMVTTSRSGRTTMATNTVVIYQFNGFALTGKTRFDISSSPMTHGPAPIPANLAFGDLDGDGVLELIVANRGEVRVYSFDDTLTPTLVTSASGFVPSAPGSSLEVSSGDVDGDGIDEVMVGFTDGVDAYVGFCGEDLKVKDGTIKTFVKEKTAPNLSAMDWTGDGSSEVLVGQGADAGNDSTIRVYDIQGTVLKEMTVFDRSVKYGVNAAFGVKK